MATTPDDARTIGQALTAEATLARVASGSAVGPGPLRVLLALWLGTRAGGLGITTGILYDLAAVAPPRVRKYLGQLQGARLIRRTKATRQDAPLVYITEAGAQLVRVYLLAAERSERAFEQKTRENL